jgi:NAD(P)-dependent dehydrogenase (short-subunit alcohol dehydrogenase family)
MHMALEADLGVDSIKRVEILSAVRERAPGLPEVDAGEMARLQTLGQVVDHLRSSIGIAPLSPSAGAPVASVEVVEALDPALGRWELEAVDAPALGLSMPGLLPGAKVSIVPDHPVADALAAELRTQGLTVTVGVDGAADVAILLHGLLDDGVDAALRSAFLAAKAVAPKFSGAGGLMVTVQDTGGDFGLSGSDRAELGGLAGLAKTAAQEWPAAACKAIDIERGSRSPAEIARALVEELLRGGAEPEVGLTADGRRLALRSVKRAVARGESVIAKDTVVVATGGARGVTAACLIALAKARGGRYLLLGRTALAEEPAAARGAKDEPALKKALLDEAKAKGALPTPAELGKKVAAILAGREARATMDAIRAAGAEVKYLPVDVNDAAAVRAALDEVRSAWGPIGALVHGAGVLADKLIAEKTPESFDQVYATKVVSLRTLLDALRDDPLKGIVLFSSVAGRCGNRGQVDYAMANEVLAKVADREQARRPGAIVKALQWGPWEGGMVTKELKAKFSALGVPLIPIAAGARWMVEELASPGSVEIVLGGEPRMAPLASGKDGKPQLSLRTRVDAAGFPYLADHVVAGTPVLPVVMALEWFAKAAKALRPDLSLVELRDVRVLRPVRLDGFGGAGDWFDVVAKELTNGAGATLSLTLTRPGQPAPSYSATAVLAAQAASAPRAPAVPTLEPLVGPVYDGNVLFHGHQFQVLTEVELSDRGAVAAVGSTDEVGWHGAWSTDPAGLDGGLQLVLLWSNKVLGGPSLPMGLSAMKTFAEGPQGPLRAVLTGERRGADKTVTDVVFLDRSGKVVSELRGVEAILRPS